MNQWFSALLSVLLITIAFAAVQSAAEISEDSDAFVMPFYGMEKKWSRREPSIRFFKRNGQSSLPQYLWDN